MRPKRMNGAPMSTLGPMPVQSVERPHDLPRALEAEWRRGGFDAEVAAAFAHPLPALEERVKTPRQVRECGLCGELGHNRRGCPLAKEPAT